MGSACSQCQPSKLTENELSTTSRKISKKQSDQQSEIELLNEEDRMKIKSGLQGRIYMKNGGWYEGEWYEGQRQGQGVYQWQDQTKYQGSFANGVISGKGIITYPDGDTYEGEWSNGEANGVGIYRKSNGYSYSGQWFNDVPHGVGVECWPNKSKFEVFQSNMTSQGQYQNGKKQGKGTLEFHDKTKYTGEFQEDMIQGQGEYFGIQGIYNGEWKKNQMHGNGELILTDGNRYTGNFKDHQKNGQGVFTFQTGKQYIGYWKEDKQQGQGMIIDEDGNEFQANWENGKLTNK